MRLGQLAQPVICLPLLEVRDPGQPLGAPLICLVLAQLPQHICAGLLAGVALANLLELAARPRFVANGLIHEVRPYDSS
jgi:hypothetical protein